MLRRDWLFVLPLSACAALPLAAVQGKSKGKGKGKGSGRAGVTIAFGVEDARIIRGYYGEGSGHLPPGLAKKDSLPPGLEKQLRKNGTLPPGLQKKIEPFPRELEVRLSAVPSGYRRVLVDRWALLIADATNVVLDIIDLTRH